MSENKYIINDFIYYLDSAINHFQNDRGCKYITNLPNPDTQDHLKEEIEDMHKETMQDDCFVDLWKHEKYDKLFDGCQACYNLNKRFVAELLIRLNGLLDYNLIADVSLIKEWDCALHTTLIDFHGLPHSESMAEFLTELKQDILETV